MNNIGNILAKDCCGCEACSNGCPRKCITLRPDDRGFLHPIVENELCTQCGLCLRICPVNGTTPSAKNPRIIAAKNKKRKIRNISSSGGVFHILASDTLNSGGIAYGAAFDHELNVNHIRIDSTERLPEIIGSKYVQSHIRQTMSAAKRDLDSGKNVLFSGTPCQIAGLKKFLGKHYDNLLCIGIVCHGVPSPLVYRQYISYLQCKNGATIQSINFRDKRFGWNKYSLSFKLSTGKELISQAFENSYMRGFVKDLYIRRACTSCRYKIHSTLADITLGDFWGSNIVLGDKYDDNRGISIVAISSSKGEEAIHRISSMLKDVIDVKLEDVIRYNPAIANSSTLNSKSEYFFRNINAKPFPDLIRECLGEIVYPPKISTFTKLKSILYKIYVRIRRK